MTSVPVSKPPGRTSRIRVKRVAKRAVYDREAIYAVLDAGFLCHVAYVIDGHPYVTPTNYWREGDHLYWHGSSASRMLRQLATGVPVCVTVTHLDGMVLARSGFNHTMNYRSVMALGVCEAVEGPAKLASLEVFMERLYPGRWAEARPPTAKELKATTLLRMELNEFSAKIRNAPPPLDDVDKDVRCWSGIIPLALTPGKPVACESLVDEVPAYARDVAKRFQLSVRFPPKE